MLARAEIASSVSSESMIRLRAVDDWPCCTDATRAPVHEAQRSGGDTYLVAHSADTMMCSSTHPDPHSPLTSPDPAPVNTTYPCACRQTRFVCASGSQQTGRLTCSRYRPRRRSTRVTCQQMDTRASVTSAHTHDPGGPSTRPHMDVPAAGRHRRFGVDQDISRRAGQHTCTHSGPRRHN